VCVCVCECVSHTSMGLADWLTGLAAVGADGAVDGAAPLPHLHVRVDAEHVAVCVRV
jgi:hypothetical protein